METINKPLFENVGNGEEKYSVETWSLSGTFMGIFLVVMAYLIVVMKIAPQFMKKRQPFQLKGLLLVYNVVQVAFSMYLVAIYTLYIFKHGIFPTGCPKGEDLRQVIIDIVPYFVAKHLDLLDTLFFVLRKKDNQVSFLHLYHHAIMVTWAWLYLMYHPSDHFVVVGLLNSFVHVLMYAYYGISSLGPKYAKFLWWKRHLTKIQLIQFVLVVSNLYYQQKLTPCQIPAWFQFFCMSAIISFFYLFMQFYARSYVARKNKKNLEVRGKESLDTEDTVCTKAQ